MDINWMEMVHYQQQIQKISRYLFPIKKQMLTASEFELLAWLYLHPEKNTPILLSQCSGMKKEAVSRCLKNLFAKNCIRKEKQPSDERSYQLFLTNTGLLELKKGYENKLQPFYELWRNVGEDFKAFLEYADKIVVQMEKEEKEMID